MASGIFSVLHSSMNKCIYTIEHGRVMQFHIIPLGIFLQQSKDVKVMIFFFFFYCFYCLFRFVRLFIVVSAHYIIKNQISLVRQSQTELCAYNKCILQSNNYSKLLYNNKNNCEIDDFTSSMKHLNRNSTGGWSTFDGTTRCVII